MRHMGVTESPREASWPNVGGCRARCNRHPHTWSRGLIRGRAFACATGVDCQTVAKSQLAPSACRRPRCRHCRMPFQRPCCMCGWPPFGKGLLQANLRRIRFARFQWDTDRKSPARKMPTSAICFVLGPASDRSYDNHLISPNKISYDRTQFHSGARPGWRSVRPPNPFGHRQCRRQQLSRWSATR
jgi:hypothetical protein